MRRFFIGYGFDQPEETGFRLPEWLTFRHSMLPRSSIENNSSDHQNSRFHWHPITLPHSATKQNHQAKSYEDYWNYPMCPTIDDPKNN